MTGRRPDFETFDHTADIGLVARGETLEALFANAARGMFHLISGGLKVQPVRLLKVEVEAPDREALLVAWLNELIFRFETGRLLFGEFTIRSLADGRLSATVAGQPLGEIQGPLEMELKAATYHGLCVQETDRGFEARVLFDA